MSSLAEIEWIKIPAGDFLYGLSDLQLETIRERLWQDYGINGLESDQRRILKSLIAKFQFRGRELKTGRSFILNNLTSEERHLFKELNDKPEGSYLWAESKLEMVTAQGVKWLPRFYIAKYPITHTQADSFFNSEVGAKLFRTGQPVGATLPQMPEDLTWQVANTMAHWFGGRLPTIYEWEKAARGTDGRLYPWGNEWQPWSGNFGNQYLAESSRRLGTGVTVVDAYPSGVSPYGVWDMVGNLEEWTCSEYQFYPTLGDLDYVTKGAGRKNLESPPWLGTITAFDQRGYKDKWHVCVRPVKDTLE